MGQRVCPKCSGPKDYYAQTCRGCQVKQFPTWRGPTDTASERFEATVQRTDGCWLWPGAQQTGGYCQFWVAGRYVFVHRWAYEHFVGPIPVGFTIDHLCAVRHCVNPAHMEPVSRGENARRGVRRTIARRAVA